MKHRSVYVPVEKAPFKLDLSRVRDESGFQGILQLVEAKYRAEQNRIKPWLKENKLLRINISLIMKAAYCIRHW